MEKLGSIKDMCTPVLEQLSNYNSLDEKMQTLKRKLEDLSIREADINTELENAELISGKKRKQEVENWLQKVERKRNVVRSIEQEVGGRRFLSYLQLGKRVDELTGEVAELIEHGRFPEGLVLDAHETRGDALLATKLVGQAFKRNLDKIWACLLNNEVLSIGVYGMGGVGKTTLLKHIHNQLLEKSSSFDHVYWVTVSQDFSIPNLQNDIAKTIRLDLSNEDNVNKRAAKLSHALMRRKKSVLILDDMWNHFPLKKVGIPIRVNGCKFILTTRSLDVSRRMGCQEIIKLEPLCREEAWNLFMEKLGHGTAIPLEVEEIAKSVARECAGLPLGIITMARSMRGVDDIREWRNVLRQLKVSRRGQDDMENEVFRILKFSYFRLNDLLVQQCFLHCALYPEDYKIERDKLIESFIDEGLIDQMESRQAELDRAHTILNKLENACLLERVTDNDRFVKMHDLIRDMVINITGVSPRFMVKAGMQLREIPDEQEWIEDLEKVSLMKNDIKEVSLGTSPRCPRLSTLTLQRNPLIKIPGSFFVHMRGLKVLDLSYTNIKKLPISISDLVNLTALLLRYCDALKKMPSLAKLRALQKLDLAYCSAFEVVPKGMEMLVNLRYLNLFATKLKIFPDGILPKLFRLQYLILETSEVNAEEVAGLGKLEAFAGQFFDLDDYNIYVRSMQEQGPKEYYLHVGSDDLYYDPDDYDDELEQFDAEESFYKSLFSTNDERCISRYVRLCNCSINKGGENPPVLPNNLQALKIVWCYQVKSLCDVSMLNSTTDLKYCEIEHCGIECLLSSSSCCCSPLQNLETLYLSYLPNLRVLFGEEGPASPPIPPGTFSCLKRFSIRGCTKIEKLFVPGLLPHLQNLEEIHVVNCELLEEIIAPLAEEAAEEGTSSNHSVNSNDTFTLPKLRILKLQWLWGLKSICRGKMVCDSLQKIKVNLCPELKRIPFSLPLLNGQPSPPPSLKKIKVFDEEWWESLEWDHPDAKNALQPFLRR